MSSPPTDFRSELERAAERSGSPLEPRILDACAAHFGLLLTWNRTHNLTRITEPAEAARKHYLDCLVPLMKLPAPSAFVDVGSGAGFPGLMAAVLWPGLGPAACLVEPAQKRASFLLMAASAMGLKPTVASPGGGQQAALVLSRATFSQGGRGELARYASPGAAQIMLWGHRHDLATWKSEVATWGAWAVSALDYTVQGLEERCLLVAERRGEP